MPDRFVFDLHTPYPDVALDTLRQSTVQALTDLSDHLEQLADSFLLGQTAADFAQTVLTNFTALQQTVTDQAAAIQQLQTDLDALTARVAALESPTTGAPA